MEWRASRDDDVNTDVDTIAKRKLHGQHFGVKSSHSLPFVLKINRAVHSASVTWGWRTKEAMLTMEQGNAGRDNKECKQLHVELTTSDVNWMTLLQGGLGVCQSIYRYSKHKQYRNITIQRYEHLFLSPSSALSILCVLTLETLQNCVYLHTY